MRDWKVRDVAMGIIILAAALGIIFSAMQIGVCIQEFDWWRCALAGPQAIWLFAP